MKNIQYLDKGIIGPIIVDAWQNHLSTEMDPANGKWFANGPDNNGGLYGQLTDALAGELVFDQSQGVFNRRQALATTAIADNRNGLTPETTVTLTYAYQNTNSSTHSTSNAVKVGLGLDIKGKATLFGAGTEITAKISTEYTHSWGEATTAGKTETKTFQQSIPVKSIPKGKVYKVILFCDKIELKVPYYVDIYLNGQSTANFASAVNGQKMWTVDAGTLCAWINQFGSAGAESDKYGRDPNNPKQGFLRLRGTLTATDTANFTATTIDITDSFSGTSSQDAMVDDAAIAASGKKVISNQPLG